MTRIAQLRKSSYGVLASNVSARIGAMLCIFLATLLLARDGGAAAIGIYSLLHVLPGLLGTVVSSGLPVSVPYFLAGADRDDRRLPLTMITMALVAGTLGTALWVALAPLLGPIIFPDVSVALVMLAGLCVLTRLVTITAKSCSQGSDDLRGANRIIFAEEFLFLPAYGLVWGLLGVHGYGAVIASMLIADGAAASFGWARLIRRGFLRGAAPPSFELGRRVAAYGLRAQVGGVMSQLNLRLDFVILSILTGPAVLGVYAVASKFAELVKVLGLAITYVFYPRFARGGRLSAVADVQRLIPRAGAITAVSVVVLWVSAGLVIPALYGSHFSSAVTPTRIILLGLPLEGVAGVIIAFLYGVGRPGLTSWAMGLGLIATVALDLILIPPFGATGAAIASAVSYLSTALALIAFFSWVRRSQEGAGAEGSIARNGSVQVTTSGAPASRR
jgi:O-antigen/teichoic acid export membrane protein